MVFRDKLTGEFRPLNEAPPEWGLTFSPAKRFSLEDEWGDYRKRLKEAGAPEEFIEEQQIEFEAIRASWTGGESIGLTRRIAHFY